MCLGRLIHRKRGSKSDRFIDLKIKTGSSICRSQMKSLAAILEGPIQYIEITLVGSAFFYDDFWNVMNDQHETEKSCSYC